MKIFEKTFLGIPVPDWMQDQWVLFTNWQWIGLATALLIALILKRTAKSILRLFVQFTDKDSLRWQNKILTAIERPAGHFVAALFLLGAIHLLKIEGQSLKVLTGVFKLWINVSLVWMAFRMTDILVELFEIWASKTENTLDDHLVPMVGKTLRIFVLVFGTLVAIQNLGFNVMSVLAGLGLGGLAFALAAKDTCANVFGSIMILMDRPFTVGDWVVAGDIEGTVEEVGFRSTRLRTFYNSVIAVPNANIANMNIDNMGQREFRRVRTELGVTYDTDPEKLEAFMEGIKNIIKANQYTRKDYFHVCFSGYGASSLNILVYFFVKVPDWGYELIARQNVYLEILRLSKEMNVDFAYPTQTLHMETFPEKKPMRTPEQFEKDRLKTLAKEFGPQGPASKPEGVGLYVPPFKET